MALDAGLIRIRTLAQAAKDNQHDGMALNRYGEVMPPAVALDMIELIETLQNKMEALRSDSGAGMSHPIQSLVTDSQGVVRFKENGIVAHLLESGAIDLNALAAMDFKPDDWEQFNQLIGYSLSAWGGLRHTRPESWEAACLMHEQGMTSQQARLVAVEVELAELRENLAGPIAKLYGKQREDLLTDD